MPPVKQGMWGNIQLSVKLGGATLQYTSHKYTQSHIGCEIRVYGAYTLSHTRCLLG